LEADGMRKARLMLLAPLLALVLPGLRLDSLAGLELLQVKAEVANFRGRPAVHLSDRPGGSAMAIVTASDFANGTIEAEIAGLPRAGAGEDARGFVGIAFRVQPHGSRYECFYLRMTNGRANDQLRRNHSTQYISYPDFPWERLRKEVPGVYESYADLEPGTWTKVKIVVSKREARLYLHGAAQPALVVDDLKLGEGRGQIGLWIGDDTEGYFSNLVVR
jgi:hypothetical protein